MAEVYASVNLESIALIQWKEQMTRLMEEKYGKLNKKKVDDYLNKIITSRCKNPKAVLVNNYLNCEIRTSVLEIIDIIENRNLIIGGEGCLFIQHPENEDDLSVIIRFIIYIMGERKKLKKERDVFDKGTFEYLLKDLGQGNKKIKINALYGSLGCASFIFFNKFLAMSITNGGRQIICTATLTFENFLGVKVKYNYESEVFTFIHRIVDELDTKYPNGIDCSPFYMNNIRGKVVKKLCERCAFDITTEFVQNLEDILDNYNEDYLTILYYKNNMIEFCKTPIMKAKIRHIVENIDELRSPDITKKNSNGDYIIPEDIQDEIREFRKFCETFVMYSEPMFDRVRKTMFTDRDKVIYTDTDSTFLALNEWVTFIKDEVLMNHYTIPEMEVNFIAVNFMTFILETVIAKGLHDMCSAMNITDKWAARLVMKNEFYLAMIVFTNAKKRYISDAVLQEGKLLTDRKTGEIGYPEIKGFDFKKAVVKPFVTKYYTDLSIYEILRTDNIRVDQIYLKLLQLKQTILDSIRSGSHEYYKQAKVQLIEQYKNPYQVQGIRAVLLWNCLFEDRQMELPIDVDIIPIKVISDKKGRIWLEDNYPDLYKKVERDFFMSDNEKIANMELKVLAVPKNETDLPDWFFELVDEDKIVSDMLNLFYPIMESLGLRTSKIGKSTYLTNMVDL